MLTIPYVNWEKMPWQKVRDGVERKIFTGEGATLTLNRLQPGHEPKPHHHPEEQISYIVSGGQLEIHVDDQLFKLTSGGLIVIPPNIVHWGQVVGNDVVMNLDVFTPKRMEYVKQM